MHEIGLCEGLLGLIEQRAAGRRVTGARVRIGARHAVVAEAFTQAFAVVAAGTVAQDAELDLVITPAVVACRACGGRAESADPVPACPACGAVAVEVSGGDELTLESIRLAPDPEPAAPAAPAGEGGRDVPGHPR